MERSSVPLVSKYPLCRESITTWTLVSLQLRYRTSITRRIPHSALLWSYMLLSWSSSLILAITRLFSFPIIFFFFSRMFYKRNHIVYDLLGLTFLTQHDFLEIQLVCINILFFLWLGNIPGYGCPTVCLTIVPVETSVLFLVFHYYE